MTEARRLGGGLNAAPDKAMFRRLDWAPDGSALCVSSAVKVRGVGFIIPKTAMLVSNPPPLPANTERQTRGHGVAT